MKTRPNVPPGMAGAPGMARPGGRPPVDAMPAPAGPPGGQQFRLGQSFTPGGDGGQQFKLGQSFTPGGDGGQQFRLGQPFTPGAAPGAPMPRDPYAGGQQFRLGQPMAGPMQGGMAGAVQQQAMNGQRMADMMRMDARQAAMPRPALPQAAPMGGPGRAPMRQF